MTAIDFLAQERLGPIDFGSIANRLLERQMLKRVKRIVMDEDTDRALRRQKMSGVFDRMAELSFKIVNKVGMQTNRICHLSL